MPFVCCYAVVVWIFAVQMYAFVVLSVYMAAHLLSVTLSNLQRIKTQYKRIKKQ